VEVQLYSSEQLAKAAENFPAVARGTIEAAMSVNFQWGTTIPEMSATLIPYAMGDLERIKRFPASDARKFLDEKLAQRGVKSVAWLYITRETIITSSKKPIVALDDFKGVKIRGLNPLTDNALTAVGAAPSAMPGSEVYQALQSGVLDAGLTDLSAAYSRKYYEVQKFGTVGPIFTIYFHMYVNPGWWGKLSPAHQQAIEVAARKAEQDAIGVTEATAAAALKDLGAKGMTLHVQTPQERAAWRAVMEKPVVDAFLKTAPEGGAKIIELLQKI
jgi:C4-dicarboxylate-binding protein DctP